MPRTVDPAWKTSAQKAGGETIWLVDAYQPAGTAGTLARIRTGKILDIASGAATLTDFNVANGTMDKGGSGARLQITFSAQGTPTTIYYKGAGQKDVRGMVVQAEFFRNVGANTLSGFPGLSLPIPTGNLDYYIIQKLITAAGSTYPGGPFNEDSSMRDWDGLAEILIQKAAVLAQHQQHPTIFSYGADGDGVKGWVSPGNVGLLERDPALDPNGVAGLDSADPWGFHVRWEDEAGTPNAYTEDVEIGRISIYNSRRICVFGLPTGYSTQLDFGESTAFGGPIIGTTAGLAGISIIDLNGEAAPYDKITIKDETGAAEITDAVTWLDDIWGGDCFQYTPPAPVRINGWTNADTDHVFGGNTYTGLGRGNLKLVPIQESDDLRAQRASLEFSAVDQTVLNALKGNVHRGALFQIRHVKLDSARQIAGAPLGPWEFLAQEGIDIEEDYEEQAGTPRKASISIKLTSELALLQNNPGIRTNLRSHQRWYPGDTAMQVVPQYAGTRIFWGEKIPADQKRG